MAQKTFGRRQAALPVGAERSTTSEGAAQGCSAGPGPGDGLAMAEAPSRSAIRSVMIFAAVGGLVVVMALGATYAVSATISSSDSTVAAKQECRGQRDCVNQYDVALTCGDSAEPKSVSVVAADAEAAARKAERYNRECRSRRAVFVTSLIRNATRTAFSGDRYEEPPAKHAHRGTTTRRTWRFRRR